MKSAKPIHYIATLLVIWMAIAPAVFAVPAAAMALQTDVSEDGSPSDCHGCPGPDQDKGFCELLCFNSALFATVEEPSRQSLVVRGFHTLMYIHWQTGLDSLLDPEPPKPVSQM